jgi:hypothetical protein
MEATIMDRFTLMEEVMAIGIICYDTFLFNSLDTVLGPLFSTRDYLRQEKRSDCVSRVVLSYLTNCCFPHYPFTYPDLFVNSKNVDRAHRVEKYVEEVLKTFMANKSMLEEI